MVGLYLSTEEADKCFLSCFNLSYHVAKYVKPVTNWFLQNEKPAGASV